MPRNRPHIGWIVISWLAALPLWGQNSIGISCPEQAPASTTVHCTVTLSLNGGVTADSLIFGVMVTPVGDAPVLAQGQLGFTDWIGGGFPTNAGMHNAISVIWANLTHTLNGTEPLGAVGVPLPAAGTSGQSYAIAITGVSASLNDASVDVAIAAPASVAIGVASLSTVSPSTGERGQSVADIAIAGQQSNFMQGTTTASFGYGVTVNSLTVNSATSATASVTVGSNATLGAHDVTLTTGAETATLNGAFTVTAGPALTVTKSHVGKFVQGQQGATYTVVVSNTAGGGPTIGTVTMAETPPAGMTVTAMNGGATWACTLQPSVCTTASVLTGGASYPAITVTVNIDRLAGAILANNVRVSGAGAATSSASDSTAVTSPCDVDQDGTMDAGDVQEIVQEALAMISPATHDLNRDGTVNVLDVQIVVNGANNKGCSAN